MTDYRVTIVGRGLAGLACAVSLADTHQVPARNIVTVDPLDGWGGALTDRLDRLGVTHLRSSTFQHPDSDVRALERYLATQASQDFESDGFLRYPSTSLFRGFCSHLVRSKVGGVIAHRGVVTAIRQGVEGLAVTTNDGTTWWSKHVVLASNSRVPRMPTWALGRSSPVDGNLAHTDELRLEERLDDDGCVAVVGGGNTAADLAIRAASSGARTVLLARRPFLAQRFDVSPGWMSATVYGAFHQVRDPVTRLRIADAALPGGTIPPRLRERLHTLVAAGRIELREGVRVKACRPVRGQMRLGLSDGSQLDATRVWLATGSVPTLARGPEITLDRPVAFLGRFPILDDHLRIPGTELFLIGALARATIGPTAGNLHGHRRAASRIAAGIVPLARPHSG